MFVNFTQSDINRAKIVTPDWYRVRIDTITSKISKNGKSTNIWLEGVIVKAAEVTNGKDPLEFAGVPTPFLWMFNSSGLGGLIHVIEAVEPSFVAKPEERVPLENLQGQELEMFIGNGLYNNQPQNVVTGQYRPVVEKRVIS